MIVVDTNVVAYLLIGGDRTPQARALFGSDPDWAAPLLWRSEVMNVLTRYLRRGDLALEEALELIRLAETLFEGREYRVDSAAVLGLAAGSDHSAYDCDFVALARELDVPLYTSDTALRRAFPGTARSLDDLPDEA